MEVLAEADGAPGTDARPVTPCRAATVHRIEVDISPELLRRALAPPILLRLPLHRWRIRIFDLHPMRRKSPGSLAMFTPIRRAVSFVNTRKAGDGRRCKNAGALLLQVTTNLPNPAEYEADRHRDSDFKNHQVHQNHRRVPCAAQKDPARFLGETGGPGPGLP